jgi:hypothetical protein
LALRQAEFEAKNKKVFLWSEESTAASDSPSATAVAPPGVRVLDGVCIEVLSGDTLQLLVTNDSAVNSGLQGTEVKISLASVR